MDRPSKKNELPTIRSWYCTKHRVLESLVQPSNVACGFGVSPYSHFWLLTLPLKCKVASSIKMIFGSRLESFSINVWKLLRNSKCISLSCGSNFWTTRSLQGINPKRFPKILLIVVYGTCNSRLHLRVHLLLGLRRNFSLTPSTTSDIDGRSECPFIWSQMLHFSPKSPGMINASEKHGAQL